MSVEREEMVFRDGNLGPPQLKGTYCPDVKTDGPVRFHSTTKSSAPGEFLQNSRTPPAHLPDRKSCVVSCSILIPPVR